MPAKGKATKLDATTRLGLDYVVIGGPEWLMPLHALLVWLVLTPFRFLSPELKRLPRRPLKSIPRPPEG